ncbi:3-ketoacyl-CoA thiolase, mitochondrial-like [Cynoglossus semilaevis]|uniref:3-ketoacyl-CoA thiolase, mitochondrial-like n=1 Tax=Cynoglossus semilaevis TaxID=244447 RepID=UPI000D627996|nr:3-ketoacyl-CoA thiolase, mitochondrial-like [Cynoglossus semilaevis]
MSCKAQTHARHVGLRCGVPVPVPALTVNRLCGSGFQAIVSGAQLEDTMWAGLTDLHIKIPMGITAENLAEKYQITREDCDNYTYQTQQRWKAGHEAGHFAAEIAPIDIKAKKGKVPVTQDEHPRPQTTVEQMAKLAPVFKKQGTVTAANALMHLHLCRVTVRQSRSATGC